MSRSRCTETFARACPVGSWHFGVVCERETERERERERKKKRQSKERDEERVCVCLCLCVCVCVCVARDLCSSLPSQWLPVSAVYVRECVWERKSLRSDIWMSHVSRMHESCLIYEWVMPHIWMSHVSDMHESCLTYECVTYEWVMSASRMRNDSFIYETRLIHMRDRIHSYISDQTHQRYFVYAK